MSSSNCPICYEELVVVETTPCILCGTIPQMVESLKQDILEKYAHQSYQFSLYRVFGEYEEQFCNMCPLDITSHSPEYYGFTAGNRLGPHNFDFLKLFENPVVTKVKYCASCGHSQKYLNLILKVREKNAL